MAELGIDLGTTFSLASTINLQSLPVLVPDSNNANEFRTPTLVQIAGIHAQVGRNVEDMLIDEPEALVARGFKLKMGVNTACYTDADQREWHAESLSALVLKKMLRDVELFSGEEPTSAVLTVPANFNDAQRKSTKLAASLAGLKKVTLIEEPIAAAVFYGLSEKSAEQTLLVYDFGGGTFDASLIQISEGKVHVLASDGDVALGGMALDQRLVEFLLAECQRQHGVKPKLDVGTIELLRRHAEELKIQFSQPGKMQIRRMIIVAGKVLELHFNREQVERLLLPVVDETFGVTERCLRGCALSWKEVDRVLLAGGSSLIPQVARRLAEVSGKPLEAITSRQPHQAVAYGAAMLARKDVQSNTDVLDFPVAPYHLGILVKDAHNDKPLIEVMIKRNMPLPARFTRVFYTNRAEQTRLILNVVQSKDGVEVSHNLGLVEFGPLKRPQKSLPVEVTLAYDREGIVRITARDGISGESIDHVFSGSEDFNGSSVPQAEAQLLARLKLL